MAGGRRAGLVVSVWMAFFILAAVFSEVLNVPLVKSNSGTIYIRVDGSIDPPDAPISTVDYVTYTFISDIYDSIVVERDNIIINGVGYTVQGTGAYGSIGMNLLGRTNVTIQNTQTAAFFYGIHLMNSSDNCISGNNMTTDAAGIWLEGSDYVNISGNNIIKSHYSALSIWLDSSSNNSISGNNLEGGYGGIYLSGSCNTISENNVTSQYGSGMQLWGSHNNVSRNNIINTYTYGIQLYGDHNTILGNEIATSGPSASGGNENPHGVGIMLSGSNNTITQNTLKSSTGLWLSGSNNNTIYHNNFMHRVIPVYITGGYANVFDNGYLSGGNYWVDYTGVDLLKGPHQNLTGSDEIGDTPYAIDASFQDRYPLIFHWSPIPQNFTYIKPDGSVDPLTAPIRRTEDLYELTGNVCGSIVVQRNNTVLDGQNYTVQGTGARYSAPGIDVSQRSNVTIKNVEIRSFENGIAAKGKGRVSVLRNKISDNSESGIMIVGESNVIVEENTIKRNKNGIATDVTATHSGIFIFGNKILENTENGVYLYSHGEGSIFGGQNYGYIFNINVSSNTISLNGANGIHLNGYGAYHNSVYGDRNDAYGYIFNVTFSSNNVSSNRENGIYLSSYSSTYTGSSSFSYVYGVTLSSNHLLSNGKNGVYLQSFSEALFSYSEIHDVMFTANNILSNNQTGIYLSSCSPVASKYSRIHNIIFSFNNVSLNGRNGIQLYSSSYAGTTYSRTGAGSGHILNVRFLSNNVSLNGGNGIYLYGHGYGYGYGGGFGSIYNVTLSSNTILANKENGIYLYGHGYSEGYSQSPGYGWGDGSVYNVTLSSNEVSSNDKNGVYIHSYGYGNGHDYGPGYGYIYHLAFLFNNVSLNGEDGLCLYSYGYGGSYYDEYGYGYIYDISFSSCTISSNIKNGVYLYSDASHGYPYGEGYGYEYGFIYNVTLSSSMVSSNKENGVYANAKDHNTESMFDLGISNNTISTNYQKGVWVEGGINANLSRNSISNNAYGVFYTITANNLAEYNDIYCNSYGMNVTDGATVNAEYNYWGDKNGPYHESLNSNGKGNSVNGNGEDLDFIPFLTAPIVTPDHPPTTLHDYDGLWHTTDFTITLTVTDDFCLVSEIYYKMNDGPTKTVNIDGQPLITTEDANNKLEYWSVDNADNEELPHKILTGIKLDKSYPTVETPSRTPDGDVQPDQSVRVSVNVTDSTSRVKNVTLYYTINEGETWTELPMNHTDLNLYEATIPPQEAHTTVRFKIVAYDHAGNNRTLDGTEPYCIYQVIPEFPPTLILPLLMILTLLAIIFYRRKHQTLQNHV